MASVSSLVPVLPTHLIARALLEQGEDTVPVIARRAGASARALEALGAPLFDYRLGDEAALNAGFEMLERVGCLSIDEGTVRIVAGSEPMLRYYANAVEHHFAATEEDPASTQVLRMLERPVVTSRSDYLDIVTQSYERIQAGEVGEDGFFDRFYQTFVGTGEKSQRSSRVST